MPRPRFRSISSPMRRGRLFALVATLALGVGWPAGPPSSAAPAVTLTWSTLPGVSGPPALRSPAVAYDTDNHTVVLFGGSMSDGTPSAQTWVYDGTSWTRSTSLVGGPVARSSASMAFDAAHHQLILFGGIDAQGAPLADSWAWNGAQWYPLTPAGAVPPARYGAALAPDPAGNLVLFGGTGAVPSTPTVPPTTVPGRGSSTTTTVPPTAPATVFDDTWVWDGTAWTMANVTGAPPARTDASITFDTVHAQTVLFGGNSSAGSVSAPPLALGDTWTWNGATWSHAAPLTSPGARAGAALVSDPATGGTVLFGGSAGGAVAGDTWLWDGAAWSPMTPVGNPQARTDAGGAFDSSADQVILYGGASAGNVDFAATLILTVTPAPPPPPPTTTPTTLPAGAAPSPPATTPPVSDAKPTPTTQPTVAHGPTTSAPVATVRPTPPVAPPTRQTQTVHAGASVVLLGAGFRPGAEITITFHSTVQRVAVVTANGAGQFSATVTVPASATSGDHHFVMSGPGPTGAMTTLVTPVLVVATRTHGHGIGLQTPVMVTIAVLLPIATWVGLGVITRRRARDAGPA